ncbi:uncharacterized protein FOMMEDRAFT_153542 [Fomitiporia mediterranea MF3/22]|uniref:uncharacterized protein n=1 Tax=Fomitiporia mediterranea (strain MF3/22) TaxID=694068 RepID=UPI00044087F5|nr:uncharacterized protein FOMMEDRAFT_153542 [Fomitiporia mediterranea MF3/22]EJD06153.1 hypothetical protein FOMMEDRAFT_153542 [Fomitiporia mediterranea MF3/22]
MTANRGFRLFKFNTAKDPSNISAEKKKWHDLPSFDELSKFHEFGGCAWDVWGAGDELGTVNLLTEDVVRDAAKENGSNCVLKLRRRPLFSRRAPEIVVTKRVPTTKSNDDEITINTQSGSQWDSLKHFGVVTHDVFYQNTPKSFFKLGKVPNADPTNIDKDLIKFGIHNWAQHGICGRAVFLDLVRFFTQDGKPLPYDPWTTHAFSVSDLEACARFEGVKFQQADILLIRGGFTKRYNESSQEEKDEVVDKETFAGIEQSEDMKRFLWNNHFAAIASDVPSLEAKSRMPPPNRNFLHQTIIGLFGMPIGELWDFEGLSGICAETGRYAFFFTSWPLNILGGCASPPNAAAYF